jgi:hypothetical protein
LRPNQSFTLYSTNGRFAEVDRKDRVAVETGIIERNPAHGIRKPKDKVRSRCLTEAEYRTLGKILRNAGNRSLDERF